MTIDELTSRFPEIPADLHDEPVLAEFSEAFGAQLALAEKPAACTAEQSAGPGHYKLRIYFGSGSVSGVFFGPSIEVIG